MSSCGAEEPATAGEDVSGLTDMCKCSIVALGVVGTEMGGLLDKTVCLDVKPPLAGEDISISPSAFACWVWKSAEGRGKILGLWDVEGC